MISCIDAQIDSAELSCTGPASCYHAEIGSAVLSCTEEYSCNEAQLSGADLIKSCNNFRSCDIVGGDGAFNELIDCCNDMDEQCRDLVGYEIVKAGGATCVSYCIFLCQMT